MHPLGSSSLGQGQSLNQNTSTCTARHERDYKDSAHYMKKKKKFAANPTLDPTSEFSNFKSSQKLCLQVLLVKNVIHPVNKTQKIGY